eukprot:4466783-Pyramimonas_sp.AAC.1
MLKEKDAKYSDQMMAKWRDGTARRAPQITAKRLYELDAKPKAKAKGKAKGKPKEKEKEKEKDKTTEKAKVKAPSATRPDGHEFSTGDAPNGEESKVFLKWNRPRTGRHQRLVCLKVGDAPQMIQVDCIFYNAIQDAITFVNDIAKE